MSLPTYEQASTKPLLIELVAPYLEAHDLTVASRVSKVWAKACIPLLWGDPVKVLSQRDDPGSSTYKFLERAVRLRKDRRHLIHKLDFRPLVSVKSKHHIDIGLCPDVLNGYYILDICYHLQNVKFLIMDGIVDWSLPTRLGYLTDGYGAEEAEEYIRRDNPCQITSSPNISSSDNRRSHPTSITAKPNRSPSHPLMPLLWSLEGCSTINGMGVVTFPSVHLGALTFLDLSYTNHSTIWSKRFSDLPLEHLRILKLRGLHLTDSCLPEFEIRNGHSLWSVDLRDNLLTDAIIPSLRGWFLPKLPLRFSDPTLPLYCLPPTYHRDEDSLDAAADENLSLRSDTKEDFLKYMAANPWATHMSELDPMLRHTGVTHLYLSDNKITSEGVSQLFFLTNRFHVLDVGISRDTKDALFKSRHAVSWDHGQSFSSLGLANSYNLSSLRIHHSIVTCMPTVTTATARNEGATIPATYSIRHLQAAEKLGQGRTHRGTPDFIPMKNSMIETLILTGIPTKSYGYLIDKLITFLKACRKQEMELSKARTTTHRRALQVLPGLKTLRLEFLPPDTVESGPFAGRGSVSGDPDATAFSEASREDFSFFSENVERPTPGLLPRHSGNSNARQRYTTIDEPLKDVVEELKKARREAGKNKWGGNLELVLPLIRVKDYDRGLYNKRP